MSKININKFLNIIPGGNVIIPMLLMAIFNTAFPNVFPWLGGASQALFNTGAMALLGILLFACGAALNVRGFGTSLKRYLPFMVAKIALTFGLGWLFIKAFGIDGIWGVSAVAFIAVISSGNPAIFLGVVNEYGDEADVGNFPLMLVYTLPAIPVAVLALFGGSGAFNWASVITLLLPFILGLILGNLDPKFGSVYKAANPIVLPFLGCCFGATINLSNLIAGGIPGVILGIVVIVVNGGVMFLVDHFICRRPGYAGMSMGTIAGMSMAIPGMLTAEIFAPYAPTAVVSIALALVISAIVTPFLVKLVVKKFGDGMPKPEEKTA